MAGRITRFARAVSVETLEGRRLLAAAPVLAADINTTGVGSSPSEFVVFNGALYFPATTAEHGTELWRYDGISATRVTDIYPGPDHFSAWPFVRDLEVFDGAIYFRAFHPDTGGELWRYDGTRASLAADVVPGYNQSFGSGSSEPQELTTHDGALYFSATAGNAGREVWKFDGTTATMLADINPGGTTSRPFAADYAFTSYGGALYFAACSTGGAGPAELWRYDGTSLVNVNRTASGPDVDVETRDTGDKFAGLGGSLYFSGVALPGWHDEELYRYDPAANAISLAADVRPGQEASWPAGLFTWEDAVYFAAYGGEATGRELWKLDATGTASLAADIVPGPESSAMSFSGYGLAAYDGNLYGSTTLTRLFRYDGASATVVPDEARDLSYNKAVFRDALYFGVFFREAGRELAKYDGRTISLAADVAPGTRSSHPGPFETVGDRLYFAADADESSHGELYTFDGTAAHLADGGLPGGYFSISDIEALGGKPYFTAVNPDDVGMELWRYDGDGTSGSSTMLLGQSNGFYLSYDAELFPYNGALYFFGRRQIVYDPDGPGPGDPGDDYGEGLWRFDGTRAELVVRDLYPLDFPRGGAPGFAVYGGALYVAAVHATEPPIYNTPPSLWKYDGTVATQVPGTGRGGVEPTRELLVVWDTLYFVGRSADHGYAVFRLDGPTVSLAADPSTDPDAPPPTHLSAFRGALHFVAGDGATAGGAVYRYDAVARTATRVTPGFALWPTEPTEFDGTLYFWASTDSAVLPRLWGYDGADTGAVGNLQGQRAFERFGNGLYFSADDGLHGYELWKIPADGPAPVATVAGRHVFYNNSVYDGSSAVADARDDAAIAPDKRALLPGQTATFANYTGYSRGINGIMLDVRDLPAGTSLDASDFRFRTSAASSPTSFTTVVTPASVTVRRGAGAGGSDRVTVTFPDGSIRNTWLQVTVLATEDTGLAQPDVSYFGNMVGETGDRAGRDADVTAIDFLRTAAALFANPATIASRYDHNRDGRVSVTDLTMVRRNLFTPPLRLITAPAAAPPTAATTEILREITQIS